MAANNTKMATNNKMKGLLKGLRYISQIFENEDEEPEMQIGAPTDVKHVAHIGMEGQSANSSAPSWLSDFNGSEANEEKPAKSVSQEKPEVAKSSKRNSSTNVNGKGDSSSSKEKKDKDSHIGRTSSRRSPSTANGDCSLKDTGDHKSSQSSQSCSFSDMPDVLKTSKRDKPKQSKKSSSKNSTSSETSSKPKKVLKDPSQATEANSTSEDLTKKSDRRKKSKDVGLSKQKRTQDLDSGPKLEKLN